MTKEEVLARLRNREDNFVERKAAGVSPGELRKTVSALANTVEGKEAILFIGVHDRSGEIIGVENTDKLQMNIRRACKEDCYPPIEYVSEVIEHDGKLVVAVIIPPSDRKPHFTGHAYVRVGSASEKASEAQLDELVLSRIDVCREILRHKNKGLVTVRMINYKLGSNKPQTTPYLADTECIVTDCTAHIVRLYEPASGSTYSEPVRRVEIGYDDRKWRLMLLVRFPHR